MIRKFKQSDVTKCKDIIRKCFDKSIKLTGVIKTVGLNKVIKRLLKKTHAIKSCLEAKLGIVETYVYENDEGVIGMAGLKGSLIKNLYVAPEYQSNGVGTELLNYVEGIALSKGYASTKLYSYDNSIEFYKANKYRATRIDVYTIKMKKNLKVKHNKY